MFTIYYNGVGQYAKLDKSRTLKSAISYTIRNKHLPKFYVEG